MTQEKLPPHDIEAEEAVVASLLIDGEAIHEIAPDLRPEDFFSEKNQWAYQSCLGLYQRNEGINQITVAQELAREDRLEKVGGAAYLSQLVSVMPTPFHIKYYAGIVSRLATMRRLIVAGGQIARIGYRADPNIDASMSEAEDALFQIRKRTSQDFIPLRDVLGRYFEEAGAARAEAEAIPHIMTGFAALDDFLGGLQRSDLIILAARPSQGKTSLALGIARNAAINQRARVALFSLEMSREAIGQRFLSSESGVDSKTVRLGEYSEEEETQVMEASGLLSEAPIYLDDSPQLRVMDMRSKARRLDFEQHLDLIIVDYLQLMQSDRTRSENRVQEISEITRSLKALARELDVPLLAVSQLSRAVEWRSSHIPQLADLRESGSIEQDADVVMFIYRPESYVKPEEWEKFHDLDKEPFPHGIAEIHIAKHRNGPTGMVQLRFIGRTTRFTSLQAEVGQLAQEM